MQKVALANTQQLQQLAQSCDMMARNIAAQMVISLRAVDEGSTDKKK